MSVQDEPIGQLGSNLQDGQGEIRNNNRQVGVASDGDANANEIQMGDKGNTEDVGTFSPLMSHTEEQDKIIIWGTDSQCDDPELAEFEMLEYQELEAYLVEEEDNYEKSAEGGTDPIEAVPHKDTNEEERKTIQHDAKEHESALSHASLSKGIEACMARAEFSSENDVFVSCLSTMSSLGGSLASALDNAGRTQAADSWHVHSEPYRTLSEDFTLASQSCLTGSERCRSSQHAVGSPVPSRRTTTHVGAVDLNLNSTILPEEPILEAQEKQPGMRKSPCEGSSGLLANTMDEYNQSIANVVDRENNENVNADQGFEGQQFLTMVAHRVRNTVSSEREADLDANQPIISEGTQSVEQGLYEDKAPLATEKTSHEASHKMNDKPSQGDETSDMNHNPSKPGSTRTRGHSVAAEPKAFRKQGSFERTRSASPCSLEKRRPWGSPSRTATPPSPKTTLSPKRRPPSSPAKTVSTRPPSQERSESPQRSSSSIKPPSKVCISSGIPKPILPQQPLENNNLKSSPPQKPKNVRPKIITCIRKSPQAKPHVTDASYEVSTLPPRLTAYPSPPATKEPKPGGAKASATLSSSNMLFDKYRHEMQKAGCYSPGLVVSGIRPPCHTVPQKLTGKSESFHGELPDKYLQEMGRGAGSQLSPHEAAGVYRSARALRPQLGLGAVTRQPTAKNRMLITGQRSALIFSHPVPAGLPTHCYQDPTVDQKKLAPETAPKALLPKPGPSGLRPPGFSHLPPARLAAFGFVRTDSVSSVASNQSNDSTHSDPCRPTNRPSSGCEEDLSIAQASVPTCEPAQPPSRSSPQPPNAPAPTRRSLLPPPRSSPTASRKEFQKDAEIKHPPVSSPKRFAVVSPKSQSPVRQKSCVGRIAAPRWEAPDAERLLVQKLRERCEEQARQLHSLQAELRKASLGLEVFAITTQHFCQKNERATVRKRDLSLELTRIRDEVASSVVRWQRLQGEKEELAVRFERELRGLRAQQERELGALEERLRARHGAERERLQQQQRAQLRELRAQQQEQMEEMSEIHEAGLVEMEATHNSTLATLQEEHARTVKNLKMAHEQQRKSLEEDFEKLRLSLQDQVDTLTFQNRGLRDRAKRFEEALRRSMDEQIVDALAPYQHIEEDLTSLKEVLQMKNKQIHEQEMKISELEKMAQKNVFLEERVQVLQQQNEDLKARIDRNLAMSRQLSEENANLQENVEKESNEKKRLSRNNEELLWRLQTGELSPRMSPAQSPVHRASPGPASPNRLQPFSR